MDEKESMIGAVPIVTFDTSAHNRLADGGPVAADCGTSVGSACVRILGRKRRVALGAVCGRARDRGWRCLRQPRGGRDFPRSTFTGT
jgi:hypothetical protein